MKRTLTGLFLALALALAMATPAAAGDGDSWGTGGTDDTADVDFSNSTPATDHGPGTTPIYTAPGPWTEYRYVPTCSVNSPEGGADALCMGAVSTCDPGEIRFWVYTRQMSADNKPTSDWKQVGVQCRGADDPAEGGPAQITEQMIFDQARQAAPKTVVHAEPVTTSYVNVPTNFYADDEAVTTTVTVAGLNVDIRFTPTGYQWKFGDGGAGSGVGVKGAPVGGAGAVEHVFKRSGTYGITLTRTYAVRFRLPNGEVRELSMPLSNTSAPYDLKIGEIQSVVTDVR
jgi:hypothetical protein